jgi:HAMP domain-containing protein
MCLAISLIPVGIIGGFEGIEIATAFVGLIVAVTFFISLFVSYFISHPLEKLTKSINEISKGNLEVELEKGEIHEINELIDSLNRVMTSLKLAINKVGVKKGEIFENITSKASAPQKTNSVTPSETIPKKYQPHPNTAAPSLKIIEDTFEYMFIFDAKGNITDCDTKTPLKLGYKKEEILTLNVLDFDCLETKNDLQKTTNQLKKVGNIDIKSIFQAKNGTSLFVTEKLQYLQDKDLFQCLFREDFSR